MSTTEPGPTSQGSAGRGPRPVRAEAGQEVGVQLTVNGTPVELHVPARMTLSDALRENLGLTGTHVGCEHGVCGMCTVLVDGDASRACLLFACQLDGAEVVTVEGLGRPDDLHPLQEAFGRNHALQCGFCTPGFLMSSYDLLSHEPDVEEEDLPKQLSGVICRCTGYRNIVSSVAEAARLPDGIPEPGNCARRTLLGRGAAGGGLPSGTREDSEAAADAALSDIRIELPDSDPTVSVDITNDLAVSEEQLWRVLDDIRTLASCLPGAELTDELGNDRYSGRARVAVGPVKLSFRGVAHILAHDRADGQLRALAQGEDAGGARTQGDITLTTARTETGMRLRARADVYLTGRIAQFGRALAGDISRRMFEQFTEALEEVAATGNAPARNVSAPSALSLMAQSFRAKARSLFRRGERRGK